MADLFYDKMPGALHRDRLNQLVTLWEEAVDNAFGEKGWSPLFRLVIDGPRVVYELYVWVGGQGTAPTQTGYMAGDGSLTPDIELALDIRGPAGAQVEFNVNATHIQWRYVGAPTWTDLILLEDLEGSAGDNGVPVEIGVSATHIQWRYVGAPTWTDIVALADLEGVDGEDGAAATVELGTVTTGAPGTSVEITNSGTSTAAVFNFTIPRGDAGAGAGDVVGPGGATDGHVVLFDGSTGKLLKSGGALGSAAFADDADFANALEGALAVSAVQPEDLAEVAFSGDYNDLDNLPDPPDAQVQTDWDATSGLAQILNKPAVIAAGANAAAARLAINVPICATVTGDFVSEIVVSEVSGTHATLSVATSIGDEYNIIDYRIGDVTATGTTQAEARTAIGAIPDAPSDGEEYVRKGGAWAIGTGGGGGTIDSYAYDDRADLRAVEGTLAIVEDIGLFEWITGLTGIDDGVTFFLTATGAWRLAAVGPGFIAERASYENSTIRREFCRVVVLPYTVNVTLAAAGTIDIAMVTPANSIAFALYKYYGMDDTNIGVTFSFVRAVENLFSSSMTITRDWKGSMKITVTNGTASSLTYRGVLEIAFVLYSDDTLLGA